MKIFVFEHICGGGLAGQDISALAPEGAAMLRAAVEDFLALGAQVQTCLDARLDLPLPGAQTYRVTDAAELNAAFDRAATSADLALVIAPEFDGTLERWCTRLHRLGVRALNGEPEAVALCGDKLRLAGHLLRHAVPTPATVADLEHAAAMLPAIAKPRYGAGCEDTVICRSAADLAALPRREDWIVQPWLAGMAASAAFLVEGGRVRPLRGCLQHVQGARQLHYSGGSCPAPRELEARTLELGRRALRSVPGLRGYAGVDLVLSDDPAKDAVIEINPRLTVSYIGLRRLCSTSLAAAMLDPEAPLAWRTGRVHFSAAGAVEWES